MKSHPDIHVIVSRINEDARMQFFHKESPSLIVSLNNFKPPCPIKGKFKRRVNKLTVSNRGIKK